MSQDNNHFSMQELRGDVFAASILIVDDMLLMQKMIGQSLAKAGYQNLRYAADGLEALELIQEKSPDLVILDLNMPKMNGYEVLKELRSKPAYKLLPVLVQSAAESPKERSEVFAVGGTDFVSKPINQPELLARVQMHLENKFLISNLRAFHDRVRGELEIAREMQHGILPSESLVKSLSESHTLTIESFYEASSELGGDLWGIWHLDDDHIGVHVLDISGHGVGSALNTFRAQSAMDTLVQEKFDPALFLTELNKQLVSSFVTGSFATIFYAVINTKTKQMTFAGGGSPNPLIISKDATITRLDSSGYPIGIIRSATYENMTVDLKDGDCLFLYSDVLIEAEDEDHNFLGDAGLEKLVSQAARGVSVRHELVQCLLTLFRQNRPEILPDDLTAVGIHL